MITWLPRKWCDWYWLGAGVAMLFVSPLAGGLYLGCFITVCRIVQKERQAATMTILGKERP